MIELPETHVLADQINTSLVGKKIIGVVANSTPHSFAWFNIDPAEYNKKLRGKEIISAKASIGRSCGSSVEIVCEDTILCLSTPIKYHGFGDKLPKKHQLLVEFADSTHISCTVQMWGSLFCYDFNRDELPEKPNHISPFTEDFNKSYFENLINSTPAKYSAKAFLATEQRIPGLGNGVLQDILFNSKTHPKTRLETLSDEDFDNMYNALKITLRDMYERGGRDTEKDLFSCNGGYKTILSKKTINAPCPMCEGELIREAYLGGNIYFCPTCQPLKK